MIQVAHEIPISECEMKEKLRFQVLIWEVLFETASRGLACVFAGQRRALLYDLEEDEEGQDDEME